MDSNRTHASAIVKKVDSTIEFTLKVDHKIIDTRGILQHFRICEIPGRNEGLLPTINDTREYGRGQLDSILSNESDEL